MSDPTPTYPRLPLSEVPGYVPDGPVCVEWRSEEWTWLPLLSQATHEIVVMRPTIGSATGVTRRDVCALILDPTGAASLARAVAARVGLDVSGGVRFRRVGSGIDIVGDGVVRYFDPSALLSDRCIPALDDAPDTLSALAIVARTVLT